MRNSLIYILLLISTFCQAQNGENPFDIKHTSGKEKTASEVTDKPQETSNVFEIKRPTKPNNIPTKEVENIVDDNVSSEKDTVSEIREETIDKETLKQKIPLIENPFEVSHIPIRKSKLKEDANALNKTDKSDHKTTSDAFIFWLILLSAILIAIVINTKKSVIPKIFKSLTNINVLTYNKREEKGGFSGQYLMLYLMFFINGGIFLYLILKELSNDIGGFFFTYCLGAVIFVYVLKHIWLSFFGTIFPVQKDISTFSFSIQVYNITLGFILIPINLLVAFGPIQMVRPFLFLGIGLVVLLFIMRTLRGLLLGVKYMQKHAFHFFLYLCSSEIVPILLFIKLI